MRKKGMGKAAAVIAAAMLFSLFSEAGIAAPQMVQAATGTENGVFIESKNNEAPVFEAGKKKNWNSKTPQNS